MHAERAVPAGTNFPWNGKFKKAFCPTFCTLQKVGKRSRRRRRKKLRSGKGFNWVSTKFWFCALIRGLQNLEAPFGKVLILFVRSRHCGELNRGLENLGAPDKGVRVVTFCVVQKVTKSTPEVCEPLDSGDDSKLCRRRFQQSFPTARVEPGFSQKTAAKRL